MRWGLYLEALGKPLSTCEMPSLLWTWSVGGKASAWWPGLRSYRCSSSTVPLNSLLSSLPASVSGPEGIENTWFHSFCKKRSQDGNPGPKIEILVLALLVGIGPCELSWSVSITYNYPLLFPYSFSFLLLKHICGHARGSVLPLSCLPLGPQPFLGPIPIFLTMSHSGLAAGILKKGLNCINSHVPVLFVQREKEIKRNSLSSWKSRWGL